MRALKDRPRELRIYVWVAYLTYAAEHNMVLAEDLLKAYGKEQQKMREAMTQAINRKASQVRKRKQASVKPGKGDPI